MTCGASSAMTWRLPSSVTLTQEESTERAALYADISTIVKEQTAQFISGALDIESNRTLTSLPWKPAAWSVPLRSPRLLMTVTWLVSSNLRRNQLSLREDPALGGVLSA